jgi:hypothetical protein
MDTNSDPDVGDYQQGELKDYWKEAASIRRRAAQTKYIDVRDELLAIAAMYEHLAERLKVNRFVNCPASYRPISRKHGNSLMSM